MAIGTLTEGLVSAMHVMLCLKPCRLELLVAVYCLQACQGLVLVQGLHELEQAASGRMGSQLMACAWW